MTHVQSSRCWLIASQLLALSSGATVTLSAVSRSKASNRAATVTTRNGRCRMSTPPAVPTATYLGELGPSGETELAVRVASAGAKGMGAFAAEAAQPGRWIGSYQGPLISLDEQRDLYHETDPEYLFQITPDVYIDGNLSKHFTRFFNHDQRGNLNFTVSVRTVRLKSAGLVVPYFTTLVARGGLRCALGFDQLSRSGPNWEAVATP